MAFKAKNLQFSAPEAPFLKGLRAQQPDDGDVPRASVYGRGRASRKKTDEDDGPLVLDEEGNEVSKEKMKRMENGEGEGEAQDDDWSNSETKNVDKSKDNTVTLGAGKKRRVGKVVGGSDERGDLDESRDFQGNETDKNRKKLGASEGTAEKIKKPAKKKQKKQAVALSFDDDADG